MLGVTTFRADKGHSVWYALTEASVPIELGRSYRLRVTARKDELKVYVDDMQTPRIVSSCADGGAASSPAGPAPPPYCQFYPEYAASAKQVPWVSRRSDLIGNVGVRVFRATATFDKFAAAEL